MAIIEYYLYISTGRCVFVMMREITTRWLVRYPAWIYVGRVSINGPLSVNRSTNESQFPFDFFETLEIISSKFSYPLAYNTYNSGYK